MRRRLYARKAAERTTKRLLSQDFHRSKVVIWGKAARRGSPNLYRRLMTGGDTAVLTRFLSRHRERPPCPGPFAFFGAVSGLEGSGTQTGGDDQQDRDTHRIAVIDEGPVARGAK